MQRRKVSNQTRIAKISPILGATPFFSIKVSSQVLGYNTTADGIKMAIGCGEGQIRSL